MHTRLIMFSHKRHCSPYIPYPIIVLLSHKGIVPMHTIPYCSHTKGIVLHGCHTPGVLTKRVLFTMHTIYYCSHENHSPIVLTQRVLFYMDTIPLVFSQKGIVPHAYNTCIVLRLRALFLMHIIPLLFSHKGLCSPKEP